MITSARLRAADAVTPATDVVAVHLGHHSPPLPRLAQRLDRHGARVVPDGTTLLSGGGRAAVRREA